MLPLVFAIWTTLPNCCARVVVPGELELVVRKLKLSPPELTLHEIPGKLPWASVPVAQIVAGDDPLIE